MPGEEDGPGLLLARLAAVEAKLADHPRRGIDAIETQVLIAGMRALLAENAQLRAERDTAARALLQDWPELPELGPAEIEDLLDQLGLVTEVGEEERTLRLTARGLDVLGLAEEGAPQPPPPAPDLLSVCRALGLETALPTPEALRALAEALMAAAGEPAFWPEPPDEEAAGTIPPSS